jgi:hypothetical protein
LEKRKTVNAGKNVCIRILQQALASLIDCIRQWRRWQKEKSAAEEKQFYRKVTTRLAAASARLSYIQCERGSPSQQQWHDAAHYQKKIL